MTDYEHHSYDVIVVGAGGAGLRAAIAAHDAGARTAVICKSLLGKAHTVMAEGGIAAAMGNLYPEDNWQVHFRDTMRGGKLLNHWRMAELHAKEAPERVWELEQWGALFDRTPDGLISQRDFGGHRYARLAHVGDRTGLEMIRTLQQRTVASASTSSWSAPSPTCSRTATASPGPSATGGNRAASSSSRPRRSSWPRAASASPGRSRPTPGSTPATATPWPCGPAPAWSTWSSSSSTPPAWCGHRRCGASWSPNRCEVTAASCATRTASASCSTTSPSSSRPRPPTPRRGGRPLVHRQAQQPPAPGAAAPRRGGPGHQQRDQGGAGIAPRRGFPRHRQPAHPGVHPEAAAVDVPPVHGAGRGRHHQGAHGDRADLPLRDGRRGGGPRQRGRPRCPGSTRPARWPAGCTAPTGSAATRSSDLLVFGKRAGEYAAEYAAGARRPTGPRWPRRDVGRGRGGRSRPLRTRRAARTRTRCTRRCRTSCRTWSGSSAPRRS